MAEWNLISTKMIEIAFPVTVNVKVGVQAQLHSTATDVPQHLVFKQPKLSVSPHVTLILG